MRAAGDGTTKTQVALGRVHGQGRRPPQKNAENAADASHVLLLQFPELIDTTAVTSLPVCSRLVVASVTSGAADGRSDSSDSGGIGAAAAGWGSAAAAVGRVTAAAGSARRSPAPRCQPCTCLQHHN